MPIFNVDKKDSDSSLLEFLQQQIPAAPLSYLRQMVKKGKVSNHSGLLTLDSPLSVGDGIRLPDSGRLQEFLSTPPSEQTPLQILYETREILVVDKPAGLAIHSSVGHETDNLTTRAGQLLKQRGSKFSIAPVHRLDLGTSGPVLFGKGKKACAELGQLFMRHEVEKYYLALVAGKTSGSGRLESVVKAKGKKKLASTEFRALARNEQASLLELRLHTGRQHQIRQQLAQQKHPLFGDQRYHGPCPQELPRMFLHSCCLAFVDPFSGAPISIKSPLPDELEAFLVQVGLGAEDKGDGGKAERGC
ncbi:23S rRNA pseudouridine955/2504/2580 synthase [Malonomonas rubra DSM 5091]|uniref:23S rRNA pseudouridine955/2504/2580 synthase n=1 Tax=Malonomonas rubra DSM 5091 TaxID=1122189 RepID=A0A1M6IZ41_MALRU|nr:RluA family pseudouridine synthase [Malonomonas rubra]SHJ39724.1 23S rRNA pseudouridine955/2504/2580 synthase [Malonomonas rubra DSM 5091]